LACDNFFFADELENGKNIASSGVVLAEHQYFITLGHQDESLAGNVFAVFKTEPACESIL
jgi:hypothetical protein